MKKKLPNLIPLSKSGIKKLLLTMKLALIIVFLSVLQVSADVYSQITVNLDVHDKSISEVLKSIEQQSQVRFFFSDDLLVMNKLIDVKADNKNIIGVLDDIFSKSPLTYKAYDNNLIVIAPRELLQQNKITGTVTDKDGAPVPGANVVVTGTTLGAITDLNGKFSIEVPQGAKSLTFSFIGMQPQEISIGTLTEINVTMAESAIGLNEVMVIGYGTSKSRDITGSIGSIKVDKALASRPVGDFGSAMYGKIAGLQVRSGSGEPGASSRLQIRGISSISAGAMPLIVVDGIVLPEYDLSTINSYDIESIDVLKDAASAAIYGSRGSNGVILVKTKEGGVGAPHVTFNYTFSIQEQMHYIKMMDGPQYAQAAIDCAQHGWIDSGGDPNAPNTIEARGQYKYTWPEALEHPETLWNTDFQKLVSRVAPMHKVDLSLSGGDKNSKYMLSVGFLNQEGIIITSDLQRLNINLKVDSKTGKWLTVGGLANVSHSSENVIDPRDYGALMNAAREYPSIYPVYGNNGYLGGANSVDGFQNYYNILMRPDNEGHPLWHAYGFEEIHYNFNLLSSFFAEIKILPNLTIRSAFNSSYRRGDQKSYAKNDRGVATQYQAIATSNMDRRMDYTWENLLTYVNSWNGHQINAMAGYEYNQRDYYGLSGERRNFDNDMIPYLAGGNTLQNTIDGANTSKLISIFGRFNYNYLGKYIASATLRRDGSSRFGPAHKFGNFPSFSAGWRVSDEEFMKYLDFLSNLKIRASLGFTGNEGIGNYTWVSSMSKTQVAIGDNLSASYYPSNIQNDDLAWERSKELNIGFDIGIFDSRFSLTADFYRTNSDNLLLNVPVPSITGFNSVLQNIGELETKGLELSLSSHNLTGVLSWNSYATFATSHSTITKLGTDNAPMFMTEISMGVINQVGQSPFSFYAYKYDGVYMNQAEIDADGVKYDFPVKPGMGRYVDVNGDGVINSNDRTIIGNEEPDFIWALDNNFTYKGLDLSIQFHGSVGGKIYAAQMRRSVYNHEGRNYYAYLSKGAWRSEEEPGDGYHYKLSVDIPGFEKQASSYWLEDGTYTRLKNITLGYTLPQRYTKRLGLASTRVYFNATNLLTIQKSISVADPENSTGSITDPSIIGVQFNPYPTARTYSLGINVNF